MTIGVRIKPRRSFPWPGRRDEPIEVAPLETASLSPSPPRRSAARRPDPRLYQITILAALLVYGVTRLDFEIEAAQAVASLAGALGTQWVCTRLWRAGAFDPKSALISGLSLCLLLRTHHVPLAFLTSCVAIASKFVIRFRGKHVFNPTNFAIVAMMIVSGHVWVSPGQWGNAAFFAFGMACLGGLVVNRAARSDVTYAFLISWLVILFGYALWLGQPLTVPLHRLESGAFLLFTFFMISDPRTTPDSRAGRVVFAALVAAGAALIQFRLFRTNGLLWSLAAFSMAVPILDRLLPGDRYQWRRRSSLPDPTHEGEHNVSAASQELVPAALGAATIARS
jgi:enediyne biosynthesis protein E5